MATNDDTLHIVVFPWLAFGHMLPFLELSKSLAKKGHKISFITTPRNLQRLPKPPVDISHNITFISFNLPKVEGLCDSAEATTDLPPNEVPYLKAAFDGLQQPFTQFINNTSPKPDWIVQDFMQHWIPGIGIPSVFYLSIPAADLAFFHGPLTESKRSIESLLAPPPWIPFPTKVSYRIHELRRLKVHSNHPNPSGISDKYRFLTAVQSCKAIAPRSCMELESDWLSLLENLFNKPIIPLGLLPPSVAERSVGYVNTNEGEIMAWLDKQKSKSVVYVALGTEVAMDIELLHELALGLEVAGLPFVWAFRRPFGLGEDVDMLPKGFEKRTKGLGIVATDWVPQVKILAHESIGGFLTHCGWSSIIEGLQAGRPLVLLPVDLDQGLNARSMEEKGMGVEVERNVEDGMFSRDDVAKALRLVVVEEDGEMYRKKVREMRGIVAKKEWHDKYMDDFIRYLVSNRVE